MNIRNILCLLMIVSYLPICGAVVSGKDDWVILWGQFCCLFEIAEPSINNETRCTEYLRKHFTIGELPIQNLLDELHDKKKLTRTPTIITISDVATERKILFRMSRILPDGEIYITVDFGYDEKRVLNYVGVFSGSHRK